MCFPPHFRILDLGKRLINGLQLSFKVFFVENDWMRIGRVDCSQRMPMAWIGAIRPKLPDVTVNGPSLLS